MDTENIVFDDSPQGSEGWENIRKGLLTGSEFSKVLGTADYKRIKLVGLPAEEGFGRAKAQEAAYVELQKADAEKGLISTEMKATAAGIKGLVDKGIAEQVVDGSGCTLKKAAAAKHIDLLVARRSFTGAELGEKPPTDAMDRGTSLEECARIEFQMLTGETVTEVGFLQNVTLSGIGVSLDGTVSDGGIFETKSPLPQNHLTYLRKNRLPTEHKAQVHGGMAVSGAPHCWFMSYCPTLPTLLIKVVRDQYTENLLGCLKSFQQLLLEQLPQYRLDE